MATAFSINFIKKNTTRIPFTNPIILEHTNIACDCEKIKGMKSQCLKMNQTL